MILGVRNVQRGISLTAKERACVERNIPIPPKGMQKGFTAALRKLKQPGQSVLLDRGWKGLYHLIYSVGLKGKVTCRQVSGGIRVWRIA